VRLYEAVRQQRQQLRTLTARLTESEGAERQGLAQELHDQVGQNLTALGVSLNIVRTLLPESLEAMREETENLAVVRSRLDEAIAILEQTAERVREVMANLRSPVLEDYGLVSALRWYGALFTERTGIEVSVEGEDPTPRLVVSAENALFQIAQEALTSVAEHTEATRAWITLELEPQTIRLTITDDGAEFDPGRLERVDGPQGTGLVSITERAEMIGGRCRVEPAPEGGTRVVIEVQR
jgi:two-component system sensor histidine kinase UhpB